MDRSAVEVKVQRAIEARYLPDARAERVAAQRASREALKPSRSRVTWNKNPTRRDRARDELAATERAAREARRTDEDKAIGDALADRDDRWSRKTNATSATMETADSESACEEARIRQGSLARLWKSGAITSAQLASAVDIATVAEKLGRDVAIRTASLETRIDAGRRGDGTFYEALGAVWREIAFREWSRALGGSARLVLDLILDDAGLVAAARRHRMGHRRAAALLVDALDRWQPFLRDARRSVDDADLARAHARLV